MTDVVTVAALTPARRQLVEKMQEINYGQIERLDVRGGEPVFDPPPGLTRNVKFGAENGPRPESDLDDFVLKVQVRDLFHHLDTIGNGTIRSLEIKHGLPFMMRVEEVTA